jgi:hypothetical protein
MLATLYALRLLVDELIVEAERAVDRPRAPELPATDGECPHPPELQVDASTLGGPPAVICRGCGAQRLGVAP